VDQPLETDADEPATAAPMPGALHRAARRTARWFSPGRSIVLGAFVISRIAYALAGVRFDASGLTYSSQLLDSSLLRDHLVQSVWYLHAQPPAFNLFVGGVLRLSPFSTGVSFQIAFLILGVILIFTLLDLGRLLRLGPRLSVAVAIVIACSPTDVLYESWLSYEYPVAVMLVVLVDLVARYGRRPSTRLLVGAMAVAALATLTRSLLHPIWLLALFVVLVAYRWPPGRKRVALAALPLLIVALVVVKNAVLFGSPQLSSWFGYNVHKVVVEPLTDAQKQQLAAEGFVASVAGPCTVGHPDVPVLADPDKVQRDDQGEAIENFNYECLIDKYSALQHDSSDVARRHPKWVVRNIGGAFEIWASPTSLNPFVYNNRNQIDAADTLFRRIALLDVGWDPPIAVPEAWPVSVSAPDHRFHVSITDLLAVGISSVAALVALVRWRRRSGASLAVLVGGATVAFVTLSGNLFEYGENNRIRFIVQPLSFVLMVAVMKYVVVWWRRRPRARGSDHDPDTVESGAVRVDADLDVDARS
jgi:hypothetical protein